MTDLGIKQIKQLETDQGPRYGDPNWFASVGNASDYDKRERPGTSRSMPQNLNQPLPSSHENRPGQVTAWVHIAPLCQGFLARAETTTFTAPRPPLTSPEGVKQAPSRPGPPLSLRG